MDDNLKIVLAFASGALAGYVLGILATPENGREVRQRISEEAEDIAQKLIADGNALVNKSQTKLKKS